MSDQEKVEKLAKWMGFTYNNDIEYGLPGTFVTHITNSEVKMKGRYWNPLTNIADAEMLLDKLSINYGWQLTNFTGGTGDHNYIFIIADDSGRTIIHKEGATKSGTISEAVLEVIE